jgi:acyl-ACP thioesterase
MIKTTKLILTKWIYEVSIEGHVLQIFYLKWMGETINENMLKLKMINQIILSFLKSITLEKQKNSYQSLADK